jgi:protein-L-isoaspartate(D-aspartate) O-methyltransferase
MPFWGISLLAWAGVAACPAPPQPTPITPPTALNPAETKTASSSDPHASLRRRMVVEQIVARGVHNPAVVAAMEKVPRHRFIPVEGRSEAYDDHPVPIGYEQTISQPYIVALMTEIAQPAAHKKALDVGTGSGYQAAVLAELVSQVYSIEILCPLADRARGLLDTLGYRNLTVRCGDGYAGWPGAAPFDIIIVAAAPGAVPRPLIEQLAPGGRLVIPVGEGIQTLQVLEKAADGSVSVQDWGGVRFVPMTGRAQQEDP